MVRLAVYKKGRDVTMVMPFLSGEVGRINFRRLRRRPFSKHTSTMGLSWHGLSLPSNKKVHSQSSVDVLDHEYSISGEDLQVELKGTQSLSSSFFFLFSPITLVLIGALLITDERNITQTGFSRKKELHWLI